MAVIGKRLAKAPGKVVLSGEYAVLDDAPAISAAIQRVARVWISDAEDEISSVSAPGYTDVVGRFSITDGEICWLAGDREFAIVDTVLRASGGDLAGNCSITLDSSEFIDAVTRQKTGLGSSAAVTVALSAAIRNSVDVGPLARRAHSDFQGGVGSGVDIASSLHGGLIEYRREGATTAAIDWPPELRFRLIWTGTAASTRDKLSKFGSAIATDARPSRILLAAAAERMTGAWRSGDAEAVIEQYSSYVECLRTFSVDHGLGIFDAGHEELCAAAAAENLVYKPCGAGGGDVGIVFATDDTVLDAFVATLAAKRSCIDCGIDYDGVRIEELE